MLRGVNKRIIEVNDTDSDYFEKALFFVKDDSDFDNKLLENEAKKIIRSYFAPQPKVTKMGYLRYTEARKKKTRKIKIFTVAGCIAFALTVATVLFLFIK